jgi:hypothetical protein
MVGSVIRTFFVALVAENDGVFAFQREPSIAMHRDGEFRAVKLVYRVAEFTPPVVRSFRELAGVSVLVAVRALSKFHLEDGIYPGRDVAFRALN